MSLQLHIPGKDAVCIVVECRYDMIHCQLSGCVVCGLGLWTVLDSWDLVSMTPSLVYQVAMLSTIIFFELEIIAFDIGSCTDLLAAKAK